MGLIKDMVHTKCPNCREANMFEHKTLHLNKFLKMYPKCPKCGYDFNPEPGFYFGGMYFSYAINVAIMVTSGVAFEVLVDPDELWMTFVSVFLPPILLSPWIFRISRAMMLYAFGTRRKKKPTAHVPSES